MHESAVLKLLNNPAELGIHGTQWRNHRWNTEYCESTSSSGVRSGHASYAFHDQQKFAR